MKGREEREEEEKKTRRSVSLAGRCLFGTSVDGLESAAGSRWLVMGRIGGVKVEAVRLWRARPVPAKPEVA
jgi:hypothetical protein